MQRLEMSERFANVRQSENAEHDDDDRGWHRNQEGETTGMFGPEQVEQSNDENGGSSEFFRMRHAEIGECGKRADGRGYQIIGDEKKCADDGDDFAAMAPPGVNAAAIPIQPAPAHGLE